MNVLLDKFESSLNYPDIGKLILRLGFSLMFLLHGIHKIYAGTDFIQGLFVDLGLPASFAYAVYLGEVVAPILIALGIYTRLAAVTMIGTCLVVIGLLHLEDFFTLDKYGAWSVEGIATYLFASVAILLLGPGKYALRPESK
ncbi:DoxX family protein [Vibrio sp.]|uniref:DoxX family protein n=1 Tax=Vibrio sp. TaxID=678 RepID=UPI003D09A5EB